MSAQDNTAEVLADNPCPPATPAPPLMSAGLSNSALGSGTGEFGSAAHVAWDFRVRTPNWSLQ